MPLGLDWTNVSLETICIEGVLARFDVFGGDNWMTSSSYREVTRSSSGLASYFGATYCDFTTMPKSSSLSSKAKKSSTA